jgi:hypothetical protein
MTTDDISRAGKTAAAFFMRRKLLLISTEAFKFPLTRRQRLKFPGDYFSCQGMLDDWLNCQAFLDGWRTGKDSLTVGGSVEFNKTGIPLDSGPSAPHD